MAKRNEIAAVYGAGVIQGVALVTFPAASTVFTSASDFALSSTEYGAMFVPQAITAISSSLLGAAFGVGPLQAWAGLGLNTIYGGASLVALVMAALSFVVVRRQIAPVLGRHYEPT